MSNGHSSCGVFGIFLGFFTGVIWMLLVIFDVIAGALAAFSLGALAYIFNFLIALIGFLAFLFFGLCLFKKLWHCCK
jgi:hypothetical protein